MLETNLTFPDARATAVSAITSALIDPSPPVALVFIKLSNTTSSRSEICGKKKKNRQKNVRFRAVVPLMQDLRSHVHTTGPVLGILSDFFKR